VSFPAVQARTTGQNSTAGTSHTVSMPAGSGGRIIVFFAHSQNVSVSWPAGWFELFDVLNGTACGLAAAYTDAAAGPTITVTTSANTKSAHSTYRVSGYEGTAPQAATATGADATPDPPPVSPSWGGADTLWLAAEGNDDTLNVTDYPPSYLKGQTIVTSGGTATSNCRIATAERYLNAATENPGAFQLAPDPEEWVAATVAIRPVETAPNVVGAFGINLQVTPGQMVDY